MLICGHSRVSILLSNFKEARVMGNFYEVIKYDEGLPLKAFVHSVDEFEMHFHNAIEILLVLKGSVNIRLGSQLHTLHENDVILINSNEIHNTNRTMEDNIILGLQINTEYFGKVYPGAKNIRINNNLLCDDEACEEELDILRTYIAEIIWELNKKSRGYQLVIGSKLNLLAAHLINNFDYTITEEENVETVDEEIKRLHNILNYIDENLEKKLTLKEIADREHINSYYLSHFFKGKVGISFQEYLNTKRLDKAFKLLLNTNMTITDISNKSGFSSTNYFNKIFKETYNSLPSENRRSIEKSMEISSYNKDDSDLTNSRTYLDVDREAVFKKLFSYLDKTPTRAVEKTLTTKESINVDLDKVLIKPLTNHWQKLTTFGRASEGLRASWQDQLRDMQKEIGFEYIRFHGIFSDDMMICDIDKDGNILYNWSYVNQLFDFFQEVNIKPFVELGFMPSELKSSDHTVFWWNANISQPKDINLWTDLVKEFIKHCINRYGQREVESWYFEVWNEPELEGAFWVGGKEAYFNFYRETALAIKSISGGLRVGGPAITHQVKSEGNWLEDFLIYCVEKAAPLDFVSIHIYPENFNNNTSAQELMQRLENGEDMDKLIKELENIKRIYFDENNTIDVLNSAIQVIDKKLDSKAEIHISEWNASAYNKNLIHDTAFVATFIVDNVLRTIGKTDSLGYWTFTDLYEEFKVDKSEFHGNFGMISKSGLKKPSYYAYYLLSKLGSEIVQQGEEYIITRDGEDIQILAYNYSYFDNLFMNGDTSALTNTKRYDIYKSKPAKEIGININGLNGKYKITRYSLNKESGSVFDQWLLMGAPENMTGEEIDYLKGQSKPEMTVGTRDITDEYKEKIHIPVHGVELIVLEKKS